MHPFGALDFQESPPPGSAARWKEMAPEGFLIALLSVGLALFLDAAVRIMKILLA